MPDAESPAPRRFRGFRGPRYTPTPDEVFDELLEPGYLTEAELRVLLYIVRRTFGWKKDRDAISLSQLTDGIIRRDGTRLDWGAGVGRAAASRAVRGLESKGIIGADRQQRPGQGHVATVYHLCLADDPRDASLVSPGYQGRIAATLALDSQSDPQETTQETEEQEDADSSSLAENAPPYSAYIAGVVLDHAAELGAAARGPAGVSTVLAAWQASGEPEAAFVARLHAARAIVRRRQAPGVDRWGLYLAALAEVP